MNDTEKAQVRWALMALQLVRNKLAALGVDANDTAMLNLAAAESTLTSMAPPAPPLPARDVPPGKWKVDMPDGAYLSMPGDPPGPSALRRVIEGYVYDVEPRTDRLLAAAQPPEWRLAAAGVMGPVKGQQ